MPVTLKTLILEDNPSDAELVLAHLRAAGFEPDWKRVVGEREFLDALEQGGRDARPYDLILADYHLPQFDGVRALQLARERGLEIPFILVSGTVGEDIAVQAMKNGAADYMLKDRLARLGQAVVHALEDHRLRVEKQQAEADLRASQSRLSNILTHAAEAVIVVDEAQKIESFNEAARNIFGYSEAEIIGQPLDILLPTRFIESHRRRVEDFHASEEESRMRWARGELAGVRKDGSEFPCEISISKHVEGGRAFFTAVVMDITERKQAESALRESEVRYRDIFNGVQEAIFVETPEGDILDVNESACRMFGYEREEFLKKKVADLVPPEQEVLMLDEGGTGGLSERFIETVNLRADGERFPVEVSGRAQIINGKPSLLVVVRDISERKQAEAEIRRRNEDLSLLDAVNQALNRGEDFARVVAIVSDGIKRIFDGHGATVYLLEKNGSEHLAGQNMALPPELLEKLEAMLGFQVPRVKIKLDAPHPFRRALAAKKIQAINDLAGVVEHYLAFAESAAASPVARAAARKVMPLLPKLLGLKAEMIVPLVSNEGAIGVMDIGGSKPFTAEDVRRMESLASQLTAAIQRKRAEDAQRESEEKYRNIFENAAEGVYQTSPGGRFLTANPAMARMFGYASPQEMIEQVADLNARFYVAPGRRDMFARIMQEQGEISGFESEARRKDGSAVWISENARVVRDENGGLLYYEGTTMDITARKQAEVTIRRQVDRLNALHSIDQAIGGSVDLRTNLEFLLNYVISLLNVDAADILLASPHAQAFEFSAGRGFQTRLAERANVPFGRSLAGRAAIQRQPVRLAGKPNAELDKDFASLWNSEGFASYVGVPLFAKGQLKGILEVYHRSRLDPDPQWEDFLNALAGQAAIAIDNAQLFVGLQQSNVELALAYDATIEGWSRAMDLRDEETEGHTQRVTDLSLALAQRIGIPEEQLPHYRRGALLHDIGKMGVPDGILLKADKLTDEEWEVMRRHTVFAHEMLSPIRYLKDAALDIPYCHHEKWDGSGYPRGLHGEQIPLSARVFALADVYDALTSNRPYRPALSKGDALAYIREQSGKHFDPGIAAAFLRMME